MIAVSYDPRATRRASTDLVLLTDARDSLLKPKISILSMRLCTLCIGAHLHEYYISDFPQLHMALNLELSHKQVIL